MVFWEGNKPDLIAAGCAGDIHAMVQPKGTKQTPLQNPFHSWHPLIIEGLDAENGGYGCRAGQLS